MIVNQRRLLRFLFIIFLLTSATIRIEAVAGRCYLCSQNTLAECAGSTQPNSPLYHTILQYYTEPCNGQCVLFRNEHTATIRGCSWTYGHMTTKTTGWHELSPGIRAYFCDSYLCNNGTYEQPEKTMFGVGMIAPNEFLPLPLPQPPLPPQQQILNPQQLSILVGNTLPMMPNNQHLPSIDNVHQQLRQCYSCTAHQQGCNEFLDPHYVSKYIRPCPASCIIFRNPNDHDIITRDCSISWPQIHAKSGLHKLLGSDAFFCQESLCNGINFDFIMGIFHNQLPAVITFPPLHTTTVPFHTEPITDTSPIDTTMINVDDNQDNVNWEDPDLDFVLVEPTITTTPLPPPSPIIPVVNTPPTFASELPDDIDIIDELSTLSLPPIEHFDFLDEISPSSTIAGGVAVAQQDSQFNWWDVDEASPSSLPESDQIPLVTTTTKPAIVPVFHTFTIVPSTNKPAEIAEDDEWSIFNTTLTSSVSPSNHLSESNSDIEFDMNDYFTFPSLSTTPAMNSILNRTQPLSPFYFTDHNTKEQLAGLNKPMPTLAVPPFSWMLQLANQPSGALQSRQNFINKTLTTPSTPIVNKRKDKKKTLTLKGKSSNQIDYFYELCKKKQCQNGGRLNSDCLCICLPAFSGDHCETVHCDQEPAHICDFVLDHECKSDYVRYLCPKFCQMNICSTNKPS
ncbi:hypothetical protein I4U23_029691 [Adineta vaga]|nr:hypothetical protein I4U23_029691 [Adineta vaga]